MKNKEIESLIDRHLSGNSTDEEKELIEAWLNNRSKQKLWSWKNQDHKERVKNKMIGQINRMNTPTLAQRKPSKRLPLQMLGAAVMLMALSFGAWFLLEKKEAQSPLLATTVPATHAASLQLENGKIIYLDDHQNGTLRVMDDVSIQKTAQGQISYTLLNPSNGQNPSARMAHNTLSIPRGRQYQLTLPDGTTVWLNSETSLQYPIRFEGNERRVKLTGEAYFDVAKNTHQPFIVESGEMEVLVTGTQFNVYAYKDASLRSATLIEGSVEVHNKERENITLRPGQQAFQKTGDSKLEKRDVNVEHIISWRKGYFSFDHQTLAEVMDEVSRWYDIDYKIIGQPKNAEKLGGTFSKQKSLDDLLNYLELLIDVKIKREERSVIIMY